MICLLRWKNEECHNCEHCGWNKKVHDARLDKLKRMTRKELAKLMIRWPDGRGLK